MNDEQNRIKEANDECYEIEECVYNICLICLYSLFYNYQLIVNQFYHKYIKVSKIFSVVIIIRYTVLYI